MVEASGVEPLSEDIATPDSPSAVTVFLSRSRHARRQAFREPAPLFRFPVGGGSGWLAC